MIQALADQLVPLLRQRGQRCAALSFLNICGSIEGGTTTFLAFPSGQSEPVAAVKVHRFVGGLARVTTEAGVMASLETAQPQGFAWPKILFAGEVGGCAVLAASVVAGAPMGVTLAAEGRPQLVEFQRQAALAMQVLAAIASATRTKDAPDYAKLISEFLAVYHPKADGQTMYRELVGRLPGVSSQGGALVHGDFTRHNLLMDAGSLAVIDWTDAAKVGNPLRDATFFLMTYWLQARSRAGIDGFTDVFRETFSSSNEYGSAVRAVFIGQAAQLGISEAEAWDLAMLAAMEQALFERAKLLKSASAGGFARTVLNLAAEGDYAYDEAINAQYWRAAVPVFAEISAAQRKQRS